MRIALIEPYYGGSHQAWADGFAAASAHDVTLITHPARFWKWRMHGAFLTLADELGDEIARNGVPDVILASSMMDVAAFSGAIRHMAPGVPIAVYFHESQFTYPLSPTDRPDATYQMKNWASAATADLVIFNSEYHRSVFREKAGRFLNDFPEYKHVEKVEGVIDASVVLPVGIDIEALDPTGVKPRNPPLILWNQRWEHDKGPEDLKAIVSGLMDSDIEFSMAMCGEVFVSVPPTYSEITGLLGDRLVHAGWAERGRYIELLNQASVVLSTAHQEFFGVAVTEAVAAGAHPVLPNRLVYPEQVANFGTDPSASLYDSIAGAVYLVAAALRSATNPGIAAVIREFDWDRVAPRYDAALAALISATNRSGLSSRGDAR
jgi:glycosyltransferase involved in cell wall biosynthesis